MKQSDFVFAFYPYHLIGNDSPYSWIMAGANFKIKVTRNGARSSSLSSITPAWVWISIPPVQVLRRP